MSVNKFIGGQLKMVAGLTPGGGGTGSIIKVQLSSTKGNTVSNIGITLNIKNEEYSSTTNNDGVAIFNGVTEVGTMTVTAAAEEFPSQTFKIEFFGSYELIMVDSDPYEDWLEAAGLNPASYEDIDELLEDEAAVRTLMTKTAAVDILASYITGERLEKIINHRYAAKWINYREYAYSTLSTNTEIKALMDASGMYGMYITIKEPEALVPKMTSNTAPSGEVIFSSVFSASYDGYKAFDGVCNSAEDTWAGATKNDGEYLGYKFESPVIVTRLEIAGSYSDRMPYTFKVEASNNDFDYVPLTDVLTINADYTDNKKTDAFSFNNDKSYTHYRVKFISAHSGFYNIALLQFYGYQEGDTLWQPKGLVPVMTSDTTPYGEASASSVISNTAAWKAFNGTATGPADVWHSNSAIPAWIKYKFTNPTNVTKFEYMTGLNNGQYPKDCILQGSNDNSTWTDIILFTNEVRTDGVKNQIECNTNEDYFIYYRLYIKTGYGSYVDLAQLQFYGRQLEALIPPMTSNTAPIGEASASSEYNSDFLSWKAFNGNLTDRGWGPVNNAPVNSTYIQYKFDKAICSKYVGLAYIPDSNNGDYTTTFTIQGSNNGTTWNDLKSGLQCRTGYGLYLYDISNESSYLYYRFVITAHTASNIATGYGYKIQLYGTPDYESRTYIYDHGVEVMPITGDVAGGAIATKESDHLYLYKSGANAVKSRFYTSNQVDATTYKVLRAKVDLKAYSTAAATQYSIMSIYTDITNVYSAIAQLGIPGSSLPDKISIDTNNVNQAGNVLIETTTTGTNTYTLELSIAEWWFE